MFKVGSSLLLTQNNEVNSLVVSPATGSLDGAELTTGLPFTKALYHISNLFDRLPMFLLRDSAGIKIRK